MTAVEREREGDVYASPGILDLDQFVVDRSIATWAMDFLINNRPTALRVRRESGCTRYVGWGGRVVVVGDDGTYDLEGFRRYEYGVLARYRGTPIDYLATVDRFLKLAQEA